MPNLCRVVESTPTVYSVAEVVGQLGSSALAGLIRDACAEAGRAVEVSEVELRHLPALGGEVREKEVKERRGLLADNGEFFLSFPSSS
jgi:hypothetical protein